MYIFGYHIDVKDIVEIFFSFTALCFSLVSLWQVKREHSSTKQQFLFDKRLKVYFVVDQIYKLCKEHYDDFSVKYDDVLIHVMACIPDLVNCDAFKDMSDTFIDKIDDNHKEDYYDMQKQFLSDMAHYRQLADESDLIFDKEYSYLSKYLNKYMDLLYLIHQVYALRRFCNSLDKQLLSDDIMKAKHNVWQSSELHNKISACFADLVALTNEYKNNLNNLISLLKICK